MTYRELSERINAMSDKQKNADVTIYDRESDEYFPALYVDEEKDEDGDVLDPEHPWLVI